MSTEVERFAVTYQDYFKDYQTAPPQNPNPNMGVFMFIIVLPATFNQYF